MSMSALRREGMRWRAVWSSSNEIDGKLGDDGRVTTDGGERREEGITGREDPRTRQTPRRSSPAMRRARCTSSTGSIHPELDAPGRDVRGLTVASTKLSVPSGKLPVREPICRRGWRLTLSPPGLARPHVPAAAIE
jgi:hypothetical protein